MDVHTAFLRWDRRLIGGYDIPGLIQLIDFCVPRSQNRSLIERALFRDLSCSRIGRFVQDGESLDPGAAASLVSPMRQQSGAQRRDDRRMPHERQAVERFVTRPPPIPGRLKSMEISVRRASPYHVP